MTPGNSVSTLKEASLDRLLAMIERHVDLDHCREVDRRYRATLACEPVDRPPLVVFTYEPRDFDDAREIVETSRQT